MIDMDRLPDDRHKRRVLKTLETVRRMPVQSYDYRDAPVSYRVTFQPRPRRSLVRRVFDYLTGQHP
jgi:hypothetical protein